MFFYCYQVINLEGISVNLMQPTKPQIEIHLDLDAAQAEQRMLFENAGQSKKDMILHMKGEKNSSATNREYIDTIYGVRHTSTGLFHEVTLAGVRINERGALSYLSAPQQGKKLYNVRLKSIQPDGQEFNVDTALIAESREGSGNLIALTHEALDIACNEGIENARYFIAEGGADLYGFEYQPTSEEIRKQNKQAH